MKRAIVLFLALCLVAGAVFAGGEKEGTGTAGAQKAQTIRLVGATHLPDTYVFYRTMAFFGDKLKQYYTGPLEIELHHSGDLGEEKDFVEYMIQGISVDFAVAAPSWAATWDKRVSFMDPPFLYKDVPHWDRSLANNVFEPIQKDLLGKGLRIVGYGGGGTRNLILNQPVKTMQDLPKVLLRVMGSPIQANVFNAVGFQATPMNYLEVYNGIKTGVIDGLENESAALMSMKFYEVAPEIIHTQHAITVRPLFFSEKRFQSFPKDLQDAIVKAGIEAGAWHRQTEVKEDAEALKSMEAKGLIRIHEFDTTEMQKLARPELVKFAQELGAEDILAKIDALR